MADVGGRTDVTAAGAQLSHVSPHGGARPRRRASSRSRHTSRGAVLAPHGRPFAVMGFTVKPGKIAEIDVAADPARLRRIDLGVD